MGWCTCCVVDYVVVDVAATASYVGNTVASAFGTAAPTEPAPGRNPSLLVVAVVVAVEGKASMRRRG